MKFIKTAIPDVYIIEPTVFGDHRGYFLESFNLEKFEENIYSIKFIQDNESKSSKGVLRGLHFQTGDAAQAKLVRVTKGIVYDVAVDLRSDSPTFKQWYGVELSAENHLQFFIPRGFAHAFVALEDNTIFQYKVDNYYSSENDGGVIWNDEELAIPWPKLKLDLSEKDKNLPELNQIELNSLW